MPELPELEVTRERLGEALAGRRVVRAHALDPFVLRTVEPPLASVVGGEILGARRLGKHLLLDVDTPLTLAVHLMRAGRLRLRDARDYRPHRKRTLFVLEVEGDLLVEMTEAGTERRVALRVLAPGALLAELDRGIEPLREDFTPARLAGALRSENRRLKTALRSPDVVAGIGNAYSDEILHAARLSPMRETRRMTDEEIERLRDEILATLRAWIERVRACCPPGSLPEKQDLWRRHFAVHGKAGQPCPVCGTSIERISYVDSETAYCPTCQTGGRLLADRRRSRLGIPRAAPGSPEPGPHSEGDTTRAGSVPPLAGGGVPCESPTSPAEDDRWSNEKRPKRRTRRAGPGSSKDARA